MDERVIELEDASSIMDTRIGEVISIGTEVYEVVAPKIADIAITFRDEKQARRLFVRRMTNQIGGKS